MRNLLIFSAVVLGMLYLFTGGSQPRPDSPSSMNANELALQETGYYDVPDPPARTVTSDARRSSTLQSRALPEDLPEFTCALRRSDTRTRLVAELGEPTRENNATPTLLSWRHEDWQVDAMFDEGKLKNVFAGGASLVGLSGDVEASPLDISDLEEGLTRGQVERLLGPGVLTKVSWKAGFPVARSLIEKNPSMSYMTSDHCEHLYTWLVPGRKRPLTLAFRNDYLVASFVAGLSS
ncbi:MAG: hypothetical protein OES38_14820 [Gammaproteobacteria bacterium]|nr:hypothetical protein [Gammaproteobacteria bacterium]